MPAPAKIVLRVDSDTARAYRDASAEDKECARSVFALSLRAREAARREAAQDLKRIMDEMSREAEARGLTPEILEAILNGDLAGDPASGERAA